MKNEYIAAIFIDIKKHYTHQSFSMMQSDYLVICRDKDKKEYFNTKKRNTSLISALMMLWNLFHFMIFSSILTV